MSRAGDVNEELELVSCLLSTKITLVRIGSRSIDVELHVHGIQRPVAEAESAMAAFS